MLVLIGSVASIASAHIDGDANGDHVVDSLDFDILKAAFGSVPGDANYDARADFNGDGKINALDFSILASNFGTTEPIPEPAPVYSPNPGFGPVGAGGCVENWLGTNNHSICWYETHGYILSPAQVQAVLNLAH